MAWRYKDRETGLYVTRAVWASSRGRTGRYIRVNEKWGTGKRLPKPKPPLKSVGGKPDSTERLRYLEQDKHRFRDMEIISRNGVVVSIQVGRRVYSHPADILAFKSLVETARIEGQEISEKQFNAAIGRLTGGSSGKS